MALQSGGFQSADAAPDDGLNPFVVLVEPAERFSAFTADGDLGEAMVAAVASLFTIDAGLDHSSAASSS